MARPSKYTALDEGKVLTLADYYYYYDYYDLLLRSL